MPINPRFSQPAPVLKTRRLTLRPLTVDDAPHVQKQFERFEVVRYLNRSVPWPYPPDGAEFYLRNVLGPAVEEGRERAWAILLNDQVIGAITLACEGDENRGFWLTPEYWGNGYMAEAADRVTDYAMGELGWQQIVTGNSTGNEASGRLKKSQGFMKTATFPKEFVGGRLEYEQWTLTREAWLAHGSSEKPLQS